MIAAVQAHEDLRVRRNDYVDVFGALRDAGIEVVGRPLGGLLGLYVAAGEGGPACLLNSGLEEVSMRHTAAHELGHHWLRHGTSVDHEAQSSGRWGNGWAQHERVAEAFASWFLMPLPAVQAALSRCGLRRPAVASDVYRLARWLGTPYATTVRHLVRLKMIDRTTESLWLKRSLMSLKTGLAAGLQLGAGSHIHLLGRSAHGGNVHAAAGDCLLLDVPASWEGSPPGTSTDAPDGEGQLSLLGDVEVQPVSGALWVTDEPAATSLALTATTAHGEPFHVAVRRTPQRQGSDRFWA